MEVSYASNGKANAGLTTGIIGTALGALAAFSNGFNIAGGGTNPGPTPNYVSEDVFDVQLKLVDEQKKNAILSSELNTEVKIVEAYKSAVERENKIREELKSEIRELDRKVDMGQSAQAVINAKYDSALGILQSQAGLLMGMTKTVIPNASVCPGWGNVNVSPVVAGTTVA